MVLLSLHAINTRTPNQISAFSKRYLIPVMERSLTLTLAHSLPFSITPSVQLSIQRRLVSKYKRIYFDYV